MNSRCGRGRDWSLLQDDKIGSMKEKGVGSTGEELLHQPGSWGVGSGRSHGD